MAVPLVAASTIPDAEFDAGAVWTRRAQPWLSMVVLAAIVFGACSSGSSSGTAPPTTIGSGYVIPQADKVPADQQGYFADGDVTLREYQLAFGRFKACADTARGSVAEIGADELTGVIQYETAGEVLPPGQSGGGVENDCYQKFFVQTEIAFQLTDPVVLGGLPAQQLADFNKYYRVCLDHIGVAIPDDLQFKDKNWLPLLEASAKAVSDGRCPEKLFRDAEAAATANTGG